MSYHILNETLWALLSTDCYLFYYRCPLFFKLDSRQYSDFRTINYTVAVNSYTTLTSVYPIRTLLGPFNHVSFICGRTQLQYHSFKATDLLKVKTFGFNIFYIKNMYRPTYRRFISHLMSTLNLCDMSSLTHIPYPLLPTNQSLMIHLGAGWVDFVVVVEYKFVWDNDFICRHA